MQVSSADRARFRLILGTLGLSFVGNAVSAWFSIGWISASIMTGVLLTWIVMHTARTRDPILTRLLAFGLFVGFGELPADHFGVVTTRTLVYPPGPPLIWDSPLYMPFAWVIVFVQLGYLAWWLSRRLGLRQTSLALAIFGGINIPIYEFLAKYANFWFYRNTPMLFGVTPYYVILAEALLSLALPLLVAGISERTPVGSLMVRAAIQSIWIYAAGRIAFALVG